MHSTINQKIRSSLGEALRLNQLYPRDVADALTLACHPWPDCEIQQNDIDAIAAELRPGLNINHPNILEIAIDRLLRFEDGLKSQGSVALAATYGAAASAINLYYGIEISDRSKSNQIHKGISLIKSPIYIGKSNCDYVSVQNVAATIADKDNWRSTIFSLLGAAAFRGSRDTGIALDSDATGICVSQLAHQLGVELPERQFDEHLNRLDDRVLDILASRTFKLGLPDTLDNIAARWKITRERVRQIEAKASKQLRHGFAAMFLRLGKQSISPLSRHIFRVDVLHATATRVARHSRHPEILSGFLADLFGPWQRAGHWVYHSSLHERVEQLRGLLTAHADKYGAIAIEPIESGCDRLFLCNADRDHFLKEELGFGNYFGVWTSKNTMRCQVVAALRKIGRPATKEELAELLEHPPQSISSILGSIEGVVRADRHRWGFDEWISDAYDGIYTEIEQRINEYNGSVPLHILMTEIPGQFDVAENSVKAYLASSAFVVDNGMVRMASSDDYVPRNPSQCAAATRIGDRWGYRSLIYDRHFNGYSLGVNFDVAFANGLRPGDDLVVPVDGCEAEVSLIWRSHNLNRLVDVGRVTDFLIARGYRAGETLILIPSREKIEIIHERDFDERFSQLQLQFKFTDEGHHSNDDGINGEVRDPLLDLLGGDQ